MKHVSIKSKDELDSLRKAAEIADQALEKALKKIHPGMTERQIGATLFAEMSALGGKNPGGLICCGPNTGYPHYALTGDGRTLQERDILLMDFGCTVNGFYSDMTRTVFFGEPSEKERSIYNSVLEANLAGEKAAFSGAYIPDIDRAARDIIEQTGYGDTFTTRLGQESAAKSMKLLILNRATNVIWKAEWHFPLNREFILLENLEFVLKIL